MDKSGSLRPLTNPGNHDCFGCSSTNASGLQMKFFTDGEALFSWLTVPNHLCGWDNQVHGGILATILDETMAWTAIHFLKKFAVTLTMTIEFHKPIHIGEEIRVEGRVVEVGGKREATVEGRLYKGENTLCAKCVGTFRLFTAKAMVKLGGMTEESIKRFDFMIEP
ncbi:MAG TPA: PaaI family thioesterase [Syntrophobacteraceae bacterium]|nr:PaaI family thioesterase [Syntrophobacteraceae bacterium]